jgi:hypothetical protein
MTDVKTPFAEWNKLSGEMYNQWEKGMTAWWDQVLENPDFLKVMGENLTAQARGRRAYERAVDEGLEKAHLPSRTDLVRVARIATLLEEKILRVEDVLLDLKDQLNRIEKEALLARVEAAEARVAMEERLAAIEARIAGEAPAARKSTRKTEG